MVVETLEKLVNEHELLIGNAMAQIEQAQVPFIHQPLDELIRKRDEKISTLSAELAELQKRVEHDENELKEQRSRTSELKGAYSIHFLTQHGNFGSEQGYPLLLRRFRE